MHAHDRDCPACGAPAGYYCNRPNGTAQKTPHKARSARNNPPEADVREERRLALLRGVDLPGVDLRHVILQNAELENAELEDANLTNAKWNDNTKWPSGFTPPARANRGRRK